MQSESFEPTAESNEILLALEIGNMKWIADELREVIGRGKVVEPDARTLRDFGIQEKKSRRVVPLDSQEQMERIVQTIQIYTSELREMWEWSNLELGKALQLGPRSVVLQFDTGEPETLLFRDDFGEQVTALLGLLRQLAPYSADHDQN